MSHEKTIHDGKKMKSPLKKLKERRAERKAKRVEAKQHRKPRHKKVKMNS